jgi:hypothetical protein
MRSVVVLAAAFVGCGDNVVPHMASTTCLPDCANTAVRTYDAVAYDLHGDWDWNGNLLTASEDITLDTTASGAIIQLDAAVSVTRVHADAADLPFVLDTSAHTLVVDVTSTGIGSTTKLTVEYTAGSDGTTAQVTDTSLIVSSSTANDPVQSRVVYTDSEPDRAVYWLVTKLDPSDRALWSIDLAIDPDEDVIANGTRVSDTMSGGKRIVSYALDKPIPPYLMAFAAGELEHTDRAAGGGLVPLSVWYRKGLVIDPNTTLDAVASAMTTFNTLIMPYPWDTYSVVLLPYGGGMENATITFNNETSGQGTGDFVLNAHELSHHWFGDWVTMATYDDVWFKEGMATVLESEAERAHRDRSGMGRLWGTDYGFSPDDAVVDMSLHGLDKYTSGPYERAGWLITQIRATVGEDAFWSGLRAMLAAHAVGSVTGEQFIRSFQPALDEATVQKLLAALPKKTAPALAVASSNVTGGTQLTLTLTDSPAQVIVPIDLAVVDAAGNTNPYQLTPAAPIMLTVPVGGYLAADERDVHPPWYSDFGQGFQTYLMAADLFAPTAPAASPVLAAFASRSAAQQEKASDLGLLPIATPGDLAAYLATLDSDNARNSAVAAACGMAGTDTAWLTAVEPFLETPFKPAFDEELLACPSTYAIATLEPELMAALADGGAAANARIEYLLSFNYGVDNSHVLSLVETSASSLLLRELANERQQQNLHGARDRNRSHVRAFVR